MVGGYFHGWADEGGDGARAAGVGPRRDDLADDTGFLAIPAVLAAPPEPRAPAHLVPDREEHEYNTAAGLKLAFSATAMK
jgi:hypothetical protein